MAWIIWIKIFSLKCFQVSFQSQNECKLRYVTYNWRIWALNIYAMCGLSCGIAYGDTSHRWRCCCPFLVLCCYLGKWRDKSAQGELRETWQRQQWRQRMSTFIQSACAEPVWLPEADEKSSNLTSGLPPERVFSPSINCSQRASAINFKGTRWWHD